MYNVKSLDSNEFICHEEILNSMEDAKKAFKNKSEIDRILEKAASLKGLSHKEAAVLLEVDDDETLNKIYKIANEIKEKFMGNALLFCYIYPITVLMNVNTAD